MSAPLWNTETAKFAGETVSSRYMISVLLTTTGMFTVQDVIHLIQYYYHTSSWEGAAADVEQIRLQSIRGGLQVQIIIMVQCVTWQQLISQISKRHYKFPHHLSSPFIPFDPSMTPVAFSSAHTLVACRSLMRIRRRAQRWSSAF